MIVSENNSPLCDAFKYVVLNYWIKLGRPVTNFIYKEKREVVSDSILTKHDKKTDRFCCLFSPFPL